LNHIPSLGTVAGLLLLVTAMYRKDDPLKKFSLQILAVMALATLLTYLTGNPARVLLGERPGVSQEMVEAHQNAAMLTLLAMTFSGTLAWFGLWEIRRYSRAGALTSWGTLLTSVISAAFILLTASVGGKITHSEIRSAVENELTDLPRWGVATEEFMAHAWAWPAAETLHFVGMTLLFGVFLLLMLRILGVIKGISFQAIHRLLPLAILGFVLNGVTGMLFYIAGPGGYFDKTGWALKIACVFLAAVPVFYFTMFDGPWKVGRDSSAPALAKAAAIGGFLFLLGVMIFGRMLPFFD
jgi:uncharacterized membrane protein